MSLTPSRLKAGERHGPRRGPFVAHGAGRNATWGLTS